MTGEELPEGESVGGLKALHQGTVLLYGGALVCHVFKLLD